MIAAPDLQYTAACWLVDAITRGTGATRWVVSPGSRSTPLVLALHALGVPLHHVIDERAAAFFALGVARETGVPAPLLCTSGTALAHYLPAIIEASETRLPMLVVSADRPPELHGWGANQTIAQHGIFGAFVRAELDLGTPESLAQLETWGPRLSHFIEAGLVGPDVGPLHLNVPLRVPLEPSVSPDAEALQALATVRQWAERVPQVVRRAAPALPVDGVDELLRAARGCMERGGRGIITVGPLAVDSDVPGAVQRLAQATGFPVLAEAASQCRFGAQLPGVTCVAGFDALLRGPVGRAHLAPELVIQVGATPTSKSLELMAQAGQGARFVLAPFGRPDPSRNAQRVLVGNVAAALDELCGELPQPSAATPTVSDYANAWRTLDACFLELAARKLSEDDALSEGEVAVAVVASLGERDALLLGNSLAIRHVDAYATRTRLTGPVHSQRGASGIDGLLAGAAGAASTGRPVVALLGDVSFLHDLGGLGAHFPGSSVTVVVLQNGGGRIFELLPVANHPGAPMNSFTTDHHADLAAAARVHGHAHTAVRSRADLHAALAEHMGKPGLHVIEAIVPPHDAGPRQRAIYAEVDSMLRERQGASA
ncbi:MAG: 2-succinyl-5-enolpyruvyl-6-hydroxy-3-cyclohexene-1-carboxylic-acid synthase [Sandaracinaceae bacterium]|nr:2-succinyl-5-enolpyruvyl-6-hydroxy-3-cyclohexene-1-carboxylic-acid synthase [Sandaracinaceae bacterium]